MVAILESISGLHDKGVGAAIGQSPREAVTTLEELGRCDRSDSIEEGEIGVQTFDGASFQTFLVVVADV